MGYQYLNSAFQGSHTTEHDTGFMYEPVVCKVFCFFIIKMLCRTRYKYEPILARCSMICFICSRVQNIEPAVD